MSSGNSNLGRVREICPFWGQRKMVMLGEISMGQCDQFLNVLQ